MNRRGLKEWPLVAFTLTIQIASGISLAIAISEWIDPTANAGVVRGLGISEFPIVAVGLLLSLMHLGRPAAGWRALANVKQSRLSAEVLVTVLFALAVGVSSYSYWSGTNARFQIGVAASGLAAVVASARIYEIPSRAFWKSGWVMTSFLATTLIVSGLSLAAISQGASLGVGAVLIGSSLLLASAVWMWLKRPASELRRRWLVAGFTAYVALIPPAALLLLTSPRVGLILSCCAAGAGIIAGRILMFGIAELEPQW